MKCVLSILCLLSLCFLFRSNCAQGLGCGSIWCDNDSCSAHVGTEITVPCGTRQPNTDVTFTYKNRSGSFDNLLANNQTNCLQLNLTAFDNRIIIICEPSDLMGAIYEYSINVTYSPRVLSEPTRPTASYGEPYHFSCPISANPDPTCTWDIYWCLNGSLVTDLSEVNYSNKNCTLNIASLKAQYASICYICNASNDFGRSTFYWTPIDLSFCNAPKKEIIIRPFEGSNMSLFVNGNFNLSCNITGVPSRHPSIRWSHNITNYTQLSSADIIESNFKHYNPETCYLSETLVLMNLTFNDSGSYTCFYDSGAISKTIYLQIVPWPEISDNTPSPQVTLATTTASVSYINYALPVALVLIFLFIVFSVIVTTLIILRIRNNHQRSFENLQSLQTDNISKDPDYDVFISFAEEDKKYAETEIKMKLEKKGYKIAWHHEVFVPGCSIVENMEKFIFQSRMIIVLISDFFITSDFCKQELHIAKRKDKQTSVRCIIPILLHNSDNVPQELVKITYLTARDKNFMERLCTALGEPLDPSP